MRILSVGLSRKKLKCACICTNLPIAPPAILSRSLSDCGWHFKTKASKSSSPAFLHAAAICATSALLAANGFSQKTCFQYLATSAVHPACIESRFVEHLSHVNILTPAAVFVLIQQDIVGNPCGFFAAVPCDMMLQDSAPRGALQALLCLDTSAGGHKYRQRNVQMSESHCVYAFK